MKKTLCLIKEDFESSSQKTEQYLVFHKTFKREFTNLLKPYIKDIAILKPNHFDVSGFFKMDDDRIFYFCISDLRWSKDSMLIRHAESFKDFTGGPNYYIKIDESFKEELFKHLGLSVSSWINI